jgi:hypothetical protein
MKCRAVSDVSADRQLLSNYAQRHLNATYQPVLKLHDKMFLESRIRSSKFQKVIYAKFLQENVRYFMLIQ